MFYLIYWTKYKFFLKLGKIAYLADFEIVEQFRTKETASMLLSFISKEILKNGAVWLRLSK